MHQYGIKILLELEYCPKSCIKNSKVELWVETAANSLFGIFVDADPDQDNPKDMGHLMQRLKQSILEFLEKIFGICI